MKRGEARISNFVYTVIVAISLMVLMSSFVVKMAVENDAEDTTEFQKYQEYFDDYDVLYGNATDRAIEIDKSKSAINESASTWTKLKDKTEVAWSESFLGRAYNAITTSLKMGVIATTGANTALKGIPGFPKYGITLVFILVLLTLTFAFVRALWEKKI